MPDIFNTNRNYKPGQMPTHTPTTTPVFQSANLHTELQQNNKIQGAFGQYGANIGQSNTNSISGYNSSSNSQTQQNFGNINNNPNPASSSAQGFGANYNQQPNQPFVNNTNQSQPYNNQNRQYQANTQSNYKAITSGTLAGQNGQNGFQSMFQPLNNPNQQGFQQSNHLSTSFDPARDIGYPNNNINISKTPNAPKPIGNTRDKNSPSYLKTLSSQALKREVAQTEVEIQKALLENEKNYKKDLTTIRDLISPSSVSITTGQMSMGTKLVRTKKDRTNLVPIDI